MTRTIAVFIAGCFLTANTLQAKPRSLRLVFPERPQTSPKSAYLFDGEKSQLVSLPSMNLSEVIELPDGDLVIALTQNQITDPKALPQKAPILKIPEKIRDFYIIITPDLENNELPIKMNLVDTGETKLKAGETLWYNLTEHSIAAKLGDTEMKVNPMGRTISKDPIPESGYYTAVLKYQENGKGAYAPITEQKWWHDSNSKHLGFMVNTGGKLPKIYYYRDFRLPEKDQSKGEPALEVAE